jgi:hypothetical protein
MYVTWFRDRTVKTDIQDVNLGRAVFWNVKR